MGEYSGFIQNPLEVVQRLRNDLGDRYKRGFPVLKELIQNADDAQATHVVFALVPGLSEARHPLLQGDALCIINNGRFEAKHDRGIRSYGLSNKVADRAAIGKFGLGMKSVFHFCEAFFFLGHIADRGPIARIVNPWSVPESLREEFAPIHPSWEQFPPEDATAMRQAVATITKGFPTPHSDQPFALWLPLRREVHRREEDKDTGVIVQEFPGDEDDSLSFFQDPRLPMQIADVLPLLRHVEHVSFQPIGKDRYRPFHIEISAPTQRLRGPTASGAHSLTGLIEIQADGEAKTQAQFNGRENHRWLDALKVLHHGPQWPETHHIDDLGNPKVEREKAEPHGSVVFTTSEAPVASLGHLTFRWAVFLPLEDDLVSETLFCGGDQDFSCTLHGYFFVDPGRRGIHGFDVIGKTESEQPADSVDAVRITWNQLLATKGTLPLLLPVLHDYVTTLDPERNVETGRLLAKAIRRSQLWTKFRDGITESVQWVLELKQSGPAWALVSRKRPLLPLPTPTSSKPDPTLPWRVFPKLTDLEATHTFVAADAQQLSPSTLSAPDLELALGLFSHVAAAEILKSPDELGYLVDTVALFSPDGLLRERSLQQQVVALVREGISQIGLDGIRSNKKQIKRLIGYFPHSMQLRLPESVPPTLRERLLTCSIALLVLPSELCPEKLGDEATLSYQDAEKLLGIVGDWIEEASSHGEHAAVLNLIYELANRIDGDSNASASLMRALRNRRLIAVFYDGQSDGDKIRAGTLAEIEKSRQASLLFRRGQVSDDQGRALAKPLQQVLANGRVLVLEQKILALLGFDNKEIMSCDAKGVLHALGSHPHTLRASAARKSLIRQLSDPGNDERAKQGFRFLLHGKDGHWSDLQTPLWFRDAEEGTAWERLWGQLNAGWNLIDSNLAQHVTDPVRQALGVRRIRAKDLLEAIKTLKQDGLARIDASAFEPHECVEILTHAATDEVVWRMLPLHECTDGRRCDLLGERVYLDAGHSAPVDFANQLRIIRRSHNDDLRRHQQRLITPAFDARERLELLLSAEQPVQFVDMILDDIRDLGGALGADIQQALKTVSWIPGGAGVAFTPSDIIDCADPSGLIRDLATQHQDGAYSFVDLLPRSILDHSGFCLVRDLGLLAQGDDALKTLGLLIGELPDYHLCALEDERTDLLEALPLLAEMPRDLEPANGWALLDSLTQSHHKEDVARYVYPEMARELDDELEIVVRVLRWIRRLGKPNPARRAALNLYLQRFAALPGAKEKLAALDFMDSGGDWRPAKQLCAKAEDIERRFVLHEDHYRILRDLVVPANALSGQSDTASSASSTVEGAALATLLKDYFDTWRDKVPDALIGAFIAVCSAAPDVKQLVEVYRGNRTALREWFLDRLPWKPRPDEQSEKKSWAYWNWKSPGEAMDCYKFLAAHLHSDEVVVTSILGKPLRVKRGSGAKGFVTVRGNSGHVLIQLAQMDPDQYSPEALSAMLRQSIRLVAEQWSDQWLGDLSSLWPELESSDQIAIHVARSLILESLPILATQLKPGRHPGLMSALKAFDQARAKVVEYRGHNRAVQFEQERQDALRQIQQLIERDEAARTALLEGVRDKIEDFQYKLESIPFELFQNADDAVYQHLEIQRFTQQTQGNLSNTQPELPRFVVAIENEALIFMHWGRPLNATGDPFPGRDRDYHRDLEKMLIVNASNKEPPATGKFGLGFKSVFLACPEPQIVSGRLSLRILGGMLPMQIEDDRDLRRLLREQAPAGGGAGTVVRLALNPDSISPLLDRFHKMAGVLCCFAKSIQQIDVLGGTSYTWLPSRLEQAPAFGIGSLLVPDDKDAMTRIQVMRVDLGDGALLVGLDAAGVRPLPETIPSLWVLAPTSEDAALGVALNGRFDVNAARTSLADREEHNHAVAEALGRVLNEAIEHLRLAVDQDWETVRHAIGLNEGMTPYGLWYSLWRTLVGGLHKREPSKVRSLVQSVAQVGLGELAWYRPLLPNGLPSAHRAMVRVSDIRLVLRDALSIPGVLEQLFDSRHFADAIVPQETVSAEIHEWVSLAYPPYATARAQWKSSRLADWVSRLMDDSKQVRVDPEPAQIWGAILDSLKSDDLSKNQRKDLDDTEKLFTGALFRDVTGRFAPATELLMSDPSNRDPEERMRWAFAPDQHRLNADYDAAGRNLLRRCRGSAGFKADTRQLARWIRELQDDEERRTAALMYLRDGELAARVISELRAMAFDSSWLSDLRQESPYFQNWPREHVLQVLVQFKSTESQDRFVSEQEHDSDPQEPHRLVDVARTILMLRDFWQRHGAVYLKEYEQAVYPGGSAPVDALHLDDDDGKGDRSAWLTVFLLGHFHTMGFGQGHRDQNRGFLEMCRQQGWWEQVFAKADPRNNFEAWMGVLDAYIDAQTDTQTYEQWMQRFPAIYRLACYLDDYRELMLGLPTWGWKDGDCRLAQDNVLKPRAASKLGGGGISAPPFHKTLGIGACFVVRELLRLKVVDGAKVPHACAYVPTKRVRDLFAQWGYVQFEGTGADIGLSKEIHAILVEHLGSQDARFDGAYDIPLQLMAYDPQVKSSCTVYAS